MRLINVKTGKLEQFHINKPPYAILSHTWGADEEEISFQDVESGNISGKEFGKFKLEKCCKQAKEDGLNYAWIDTCCIDKTNSVELNEAINSMYHWYQAANTCYAYLADVSTEDSTTNLAALQHSLWFTRGWTLQELLAPKDLVFYGRGWDYLGSKTQLAEVLGEITSIPPRFLLRNDALYEASIAQRMSWAARRRTKRVEDIAYSLLGIFNVMIPMIYGEGEKAFLRLQEEIMKKSTDDSILAWGLAANSDTPKVENFIMYGNVLAASPAAFANSGTVVSRGSSNATIESLGLVRGFLHARLPLHKHGGQTFGLLDCRPDHGNDAFIGIPLSRISPGIKSDEYMRPMGSEATRFSASDLTITPTSVRIHEPERFKEAPTYNRRYGFRINVPSTGELELIDVRPQNRWEKEETEEPFIFSGVDFQVDSFQQTWVRLRHRRHDAPNPQDFVMVLELEVKDSQPQARCHVMIASRDTDLDAIVGLPGLLKHVFGKSTAGNGLLEVKATLNQDRMAMQQVFAVNLLAHPSLPGTPQSPSATAELQLVEHTLNLQMVFKEDKQMRPKMDTIPEILRESIASLQSREKRIEVVDKEMDQLQKQINQLQKQIKILQNEKHDLVKGLNKEAKHMQFLSQENNTLLERHTEIIQTVSSSRNLPESLGEKRATLWDEEMLDYFSDTLLSSDRLYDSLSDIQDRSQRIFMQAVDMGCLAIMRFLVSSMDNLLFEDSLGRNVLCRAIDNNISAAIWLIEESGIDSAHIDSRGVPALVAAAAEGHLSIVRSLLDHGQSVDPARRYPLGLLWYVRLLMDTSTAYICYSNREQTSKVEITMEKLHLPARHRQGITTSLSYFSMLGPTSIPSQQLAPLH
ncbi:37s ribosomal protein rsm22 [Colletotrichum karsti]|uniref:37s ribosomal protein rsm22 n=1 Tax=Colletotrichum karsti TaxID=1095194 RepID=A0A9P6I249_9PEZI|nr:37s ribosomal protein rsm22 [Colletotrichum karsti]KAF9875918.1 37s ribosomal protein rsm22 [Colletotrichum karsti]